MKQKIEYKVQMPSDKSRSKALATAASEDGVSWVKIGGEEKDKLVVIGEEVDIVALAISLKKKVGYTRIVSVRVLNGNNEENHYEEENRLALTPIYHPSSSTNYYQSHYPPLQYYTY